MGIPDPNDGIKPGQKVRLRRVASNNGGQRFFFLDGFGVEGLAFITVSRKGWVSIRNSQERASLTIKVGYKDDIELPPGTRATLIRKKTEEGFRIVFGANEVEITWEQLG